MSRPKMLAVTRIAEALAVAKGCRYLAAQALEISRDTLRLYMRDNPELEQVCLDAREIVVEKARHNIIDFLDDLDPKIRFQASVHADRHWHIPGDKTPSWQGVTVRRSAPLEGVPPDQIEFFDAMRNGDPDEWQDAIQKYPDLAAAYAAQLGFTARKRRPAKKPARKKRRAKK